MKWVGIVLKGRELMVVDECNMESRCGWSVAVMITVRRGNEVYDASR